MNSFKILRDRDHDYFNLSRGESVGMEFRYLDGVEKRDRKILCFVWCRDDFKFGAPERKSDNFVKEVDVTTILKDLVKEICLIMLLRLWYVK